MDMKDATTTTRAVASKVVSISNVIILAKISCIDAILAIHLSTLVVSLIDKKLLVIFLS